MLRSDLLPVVGDFAGVALSALSVGEAVRLRAPRPVVGRMLRNLGIDFVIGLVPVVGDLADIYWKATTRNLRELENWLDQPPERPRARWPQAVDAGRRGAAGSRAELVAGRRHCLNTGRS